MAIEAARIAIAGLPIDGRMMVSVRETARLTATHYSSQIEGSRLTPTEVRNYYRSLEEVDALAASQGAIALTPYRDGQNVIREAGTSSIVYLPPEASKVLALLTGVVPWIDWTLTGADSPAPIAAALAHYQFATIHPYYDGNGRTARLLTILILYKTGYGLKGIYNLEEYYTRSLPDYYAALTVGSSHNYYFGRFDGALRTRSHPLCEGHCGVRPGDGRQSTLSETNFTRSGTIRSDDGIIQIERLFFDGSLADMCNYEVYGRPGPQNIGSGFTGTGHVQQHDSMGEIVGVREGDGMHTAD